MGTLIDRVLCGTSPKPAALYRDALEDRLNYLGALVKDPDPNVRRLLLRVCLAWVPPGEYNNAFRGSATDSRQAQQRRAAQAHTEMLLRQLLQDHDESVRADARARVIQSFSFSNINTYSRRTDLYEFLATDVDKWTDEERSALAIALQSHKPPTSPSRPSQYGSQYLRPRQSDPSERERGRFDQAFAALTQALLPRSRAERFRQFATNHQEHALPEVPSESELILLQNCIQDALGMQSDFAWLDRTRSNALGVDRVVYWLGKYDAEGKLTEAVQQHTEHNPESNVCSLYWLGQQDANGESAVDSQLARWHRGPLRDARLRFVADATTLTGARVQWLLEAATAPDVAESALERLLYSRTVHKLEPASRDTICEAFSNRPELMGAALTMSIVAVAESAPSVNTVNLCKRALDSMLRLKRCPGITSNFWQYCAHLVARAGESRWTMQHLLQASLTDWANPSPPITDTLEQWPSDCLEGLYSSIECLYDEPSKRDALRALLRRSAIANLVPSQILTWVGDDANRARWVLSWNVVAHRPLRSPMTELIDRFRGNPEFRRDAIALVQSVVNHASASRERVPSIVDLAAHIEGKPSAWVAEVRRRVGISDDFSKAG